MSYDPTEPTTLDRIRGIVGDIDTPEILPDATYSSVIARFTNWKRAAAEMASRVAVKIEQDPTSVNFQGEMSAGWQDRTRSLRAIAARYEAEADDEDAAVTTAPAYAPVLTPVEWR